MVTRKEVAELAKVSEATVSRVFNGLGPMKPATKERVLEAAKVLGTILMRLRKASLEEEVAILVWCFRICRRCICFLPIILQKF